MGIEDVFVKWVIPDVRLGHPWHPCIKFSFKLKNLKILNAFYSYLSNDTIPYLFLLCLYVHVTNIFLIFIIFIFKKFIWKSSSGVQQNWIGRHKKVTKTLWSIKWNLIKISYFFLLLLLLLLVSVYISSSIIGCIKSFPSRLFQQKFIPRWNSCWGY